MIHAMNEKQILIVEDEPSLAEVTGLYLKRAGFQVQIAHDGKQAMSILEKGIPDFVIMDIMLPEHLIDALAARPFGCADHHGHSPP
jgi:DNA-binding response OmpR family regulator